MIVHVYKDLSSYIKELQNRIYLFIFCILWYNSQNVKAESLFHIKAQILLWCLVKFGSWINWQQYQSWDLKINIFIKMKLD